MFRDTIVEIELEFLPELNVIIQLQHTAPHVPAITPISYIKVLYKTNIKQDSR